MQLSGAQLSLHRSLRGAALVTTLGLALMAFAGAAGAQAAIQCGDELTHSVTLNKNLDCSASSSHGLIVKKSGITINLNGHTITGGGGAENYNGIDNTIYDKDRVTVLNGTLRDWYVGIWNQGGAKLTVRNVRVFLDGDHQWYGYYDEYGTGVRISGIRVDNASYGIYFGSGSGNVVARSKVTHSQYSVYLSEQAYSRVSYMQVLKSRGDQTGFYDDDGFANTWDHDIVRGGDVESGFFLNSPLKIKVVDSVAANTTSYGLYISNNDFEDGYRATLIRNRFLNNEEYGAYADSMGTISKGNVALGNPYPCRYIACN